MSTGGVVYAKHMSPSPGATAGWTEMRGQKLALQLTITYTQDMELG